LRPAGWLTPGVRGIGSASFLSDLGHEVPTSLLPGFLTSTLGAPATALGLIEGIADGLAGAAKLGGGALADDPERRRATAVGGYASTAILSGLIGVAASTWQVGVLRAAAWTSRGLRVPSRNALLADVVPAEFYGRAYGFERAMDNFGAIGGPLLALALVALFDVRTAMLLSIVPGMLAVVAILYAIRRTRRPEVRPHTPIRIRIRPVVEGELRPLFAGITAFELGNVAATLMILRATDLLTPGHGSDAATKLALGLYVAYNAAATLTSVPAGHMGDRRGMVGVLAVGVACFAGAYALLAATGASLALLAVAFLAAGVGIGAVETAEHAAVAALAPEHLRGSAFGLLATVQSFGNFAASAVVGLLYTVASPALAYGWATALMVLALALLLRELTRGRGAAAPG
jgi:MFS family permease